MKRIEIHYTFFFSYTLSSVFKVITKVIKLGNKLIIYNMKISKF